MDSDMDSNNERGHASEVISEMLVRVNWVNFCELKGNAVIFFIVSGLFRINGNSGELQMGHRNKQKTVILECTTPGGYSTEDDT